MSIAKTFATFQLLCALTTPLWVGGCADRSQMRESSWNAPNAPNAKTVAYRKPISAESALIEAEEAASPSDLQPSATITPSALPKPQLLPSPTSPTAASTFTPTMVLPRDAGQEPTHFQDLSLLSALQTAFTASPVIRSLGGRLIDQPEAASTIYDVEISESDPFFGPQAALAQFDSVLAAGLTSANHDRVFNNEVLGGGTQELVQDVAAGTASWQRRNQNGTLFDVRGINGYDANNRTGNRFPSFWETQLEAGVRKPLMRGAGRDFNRIAGPHAQPGFNFANGIVLAQMNTHLEQADFEIAVQRFTRELHAAYWSLSQSYQRYDQLRQTRDMAYDTWQTLKAKASQGLEGGQIDKEAQARQKYYRYQRELVDSLSGTTEGTGLYEAERRLRYLLGLPLLDATLLRPSDTMPLAPVIYDWESLVAASMTDRIELRRQAIKVRQQQLKLVASKNFLLPQLDLIGRYRVRGFGDDLVGDGPRFASSYDDFFSLDHQEFEFGVEWGNTVGRRQGRAAVRNATLLLQRERAVLAEQQRELTLLLSDAVSRVHSKYLALESGQQEYAAAESRTRATRVLFELGKTDLFMLLDARESQLEASEHAIADQTAYVLALVDVAYQSGRLLRDNGIALACTHVQVTPRLTTASMQPQDFVPTGAWLPQRDEEIFPTPKPQPIGRSSEYAR